ncbi:MAG TPA: gluconate 2-dehydrogenase subunit 3 family protein [Alphaproteobacteria bacterium]
MAHEPIPRRQFLAGAGAAGTAVAGALAGGLTAPAAAEPSDIAPAKGAPAPQVSAAPETWLALTAAEAAFVIAAVDTLIPADELTPSGSECGVAVYIDRQLASAWGGGAKMYRSGPFQKGKPEQGYQLALTPRDYLVAGIAAANAWTQKTYGKDFDRLAPEDRVVALKAMEDGKAEFQNFNARGFFERLLAMTMEGFFADPVYGGNRDKIAWKMIGFPGLPATYAGLVDEFRDKRYVAEPQSIADFS